MELYGLSVEQVMRVQVYLGSVMSVILLFKVVQGRRGVTDHLRQRGCQRLRPV